MNFQNYYQGNPRNFMNTEFSSEDDRQETSNNGTIDIDPKGVSIPEIYSAQHHRRPVVVLNPDQVKNPKKRFSKNLDISSLDDQIIKNNFFLEKGNPHYEQESESSEIEKITRIMTNKKIENMIVLEENSQAENTPQSQPPAKIPNFNVLSNFSAYKQNQPHLHTDGSSPLSQGNDIENRNFTEDSQELERVQRIGPRKNDPSSTALKSDRPNEVKKPFIYRNFVSNSLFKFEKEKKNTDSNSNHRTTSITVIQDGEGNPLSRSEVIDSYHHRLNDSNISKRPANKSKAEVTQRSKKGKKGQRPPAQLFDMPEFSDKEIMEAYSTLDMNKTGAVTAEEIKHFMEVIIEDVTDADIDEMIKMIDPEGTQQVTFEQFYKLIVGQDYNAVKTSEMHEEDLFEQKRNASTTTRRQRADSMDPSSRKLMTSIRNPDSSRYSASRFSPAKVEGAVTGNLHAVKTTSKFNKFFKGNFAEDDNVSFEEDADEIDAPLKTFIRQAGLNMRVYMQKYDTIQFSNSNKISKIAYKDFLAFFDVGDEDATRKTFAIISKDKNYIDLRQMFIALSLYFDFDSEQKISLAYDLFDPDGNGCILYLEVMKAFSMFQLREESKRLEKKVKTLLNRRSVMPEDTISKEEFFAACNTFPNLFDV